MESYKPKNQSETKEYNKLVTEYKKNFEILLTKVDYNDSETQKELGFSALESEINIQTLEYAKKLEEKMILAGEMMKDCAETISSQGQNLDLIEVEVLTAEKYAAKGANQLEKTDLRQRRKKKCCYLILLAAACFLIAIVIVSVIVSRKN